MKRTLLLIFIGILSVSAVGQDHIRLIESGERNFELIEEAFYNWYNATGSKESDLKKFERWKHYIEPRLENGQIPGARNELQKITEFSNLKRISTSLRTENTNTWEALGPETWTVNTHGYSPGNGRVNCTEVDPNDPNKIFAGSASGGIWISEDGGNSWYSTTDQLAVLGISDIQVNPQNSMEVWALTGDGNASTTPSIGLLKSEDGGMTWQVTSFVSDYSDYKVFRTLRMNDQNPDHMMIGGSDGVYLTKDGGETWTLEIVDNISDVIFHPTDPNIAYAAVYWEDAEGAVSMYKSTDGGESWSYNVFMDFDPSISNFLTRKVIGVSAANPSRVYVLAVSSENNELGGVFRSDDELNTLELISTSPNILGYSKTGTDSRGQGWYDLAIAVDPTDADHVYTGGIHVWSSSNGGQDWDLENYWVWDDSEYPYVHADVHSLEFFNNKLYAGTDGGLFMTENEGSSWLNLSFGMNIGQFYRLGVHPSNENIVAGGLQDNGSFYKGIGGWQQIYGADGMEAIIDYNQPATIYSSSQYGSIKRFDFEGSIIGRYIEKPEGESGAWITPYIMHPYESNTLYFGYQDVYRSLNKGNSLVKISRFEDTEEIRVLKQHNLYPSNLLVVRDNKLYRTENEGGNWDFVGRDLLFISRTLTDAAFSYTDPQTMYVTTGGTETVNKVLFTIDGGANWEDYSEGLPAVTINCIISRNDCEGTLYVGTDIGVYRRKRDDTSWQPLGVGLPNVIVEELEIQKSTNKLFAATYGRGIWSIDMEDGEEQFMTVEPIPDKFWGDEDFQVVANSVLPNDILISSLNPEIIEINGDIASIKGIGEALIQVVQEGTCSIDIPVIVNKAQQTITFAPTVIYPDTQWEFTLSAEASSGLPVQFFSQNLGVVKIEGNIGYIQRAGSTRITAIQVGNDYYQQAPAISRNITITEDRSAFISLYPNPVYDNKITLDIPKNKGKSLEINIYDMKGNILHTSEVAVTREPAELDISDLQQGLYYIKVGEVSFRFLKY